MTDIALELLDDGRTFAPVLFKGDLIRDDSLRTAILVSLFTDREATAEQLTAAGMDPTDRRGWWGDVLAATPGDLQGSHLWLLERRKRTPAVLPDAKRYAEDALSWIVSAGLASAVTVVAYFDERGELAFDVDVARPNGTEQYRALTIWTANFAADPIGEANEEAASLARTAALLENIWLVEIPEITHE
ncbi:phage GP46 family protein [Hydrocarboniphaga effusa]|uniref:phage GP46 family protein n=1 Tax=Hydrocarboniphaga effusa TaxID=243629 RepID=UPI003BAA65CF